MGDLVLQSGYHALDVVGTKEVPFQNEVGLAAATYLSWVMNEGPCQGVLLLNNTPQIRSKSSRVLLELSGVWATLLKVLDVLIAIKVKFTPLFDDVTTTHMLPVHGRKMPVVDPFFEAFEESKRIVTLFDVEDTVSCGVRVHGTE